VQAPRSEAVGIANMSLGNSQINLAVRCDVPKEDCEVLPPSSLRLLRLASTLVDHGKVTALSAIGFHVKHHDTVLSALNLEATGIAGDECGCSATRQQRRIVMFFEHQPHGSDLSSRLATSIFSCVHSRYAAKNAYGLACRPKARVHRSSARSSKSWLGLPKTAGRSTASNKRTRLDCRLVITRTNTT
jgi:hypothetical protein